MAPLPNPNKPKGFFPISKYRLYSTIGILVACVLSINPFTFQHQVAGTALINWLLVVIMLLALAVMVIDLLITPSDDLDRSATGQPVSADKVDDLVPAASNIEGR